MIISVSITLILIISIIIDILFGDPRNRYHPVAWIGKIIKYFIPKLKIDKRDKKTLEKKRGIVFTILFVLSSVILIQFSLYFMYHNYYLIFFIASVYLLYSSISIKNMENHINMILNALHKKDIVSARKKLSMIVGRDTKELEEQHIISGAIESIAESTVDGIISPIFYFSIFGSCGAFVFRIINTLDSMIGYRNNCFINIGWMSAKFDTFANYIPARLTSIFIIVSSFFIKANWKNSIKILKMERHKTASVNSGYPMSAMAGALDVSLEKIHFYQIGIPVDQLTVEKCRVAIKIMKITVVLFCLFISIPLVFLLGLVKWWNILFGI